MRSSTACLVTSLLTVIVIISLCRFTFWNSFSFFNPNLPVNCDESTANSNAINYMTVEEDDLEIIKCDKSLIIFKIKKEFLKHGSRGLIAPPEYWIFEYARLYSDLDIVVPTNKNTSFIMQARRAYTEFLSNVVTARSFGDAELSVIPALNASIFKSKKLNETQRQGGLDWTYLGMTMTGQKRIRNVEILIRKVITNNIPGAYIETGVWRGGSSIFARGVLRAYNEGHRLSYVCDSFRGLPPGNNKLHSRETGWDNTAYLEVDHLTVVQNFQKVSLLSSNVIFVKGFFNDTMPVLSKMVTEIAILRLDGDMYESTADVLYNLYDKISLNGFIIIDDWQFNLADFPAKVACEDFFAVHKMSPELFPIDSTSVYWQKTVDIKIEYWRYKQGNFTLN